MENLSANSQDYRAFAKQILQGDPKDPKAKAGYGWIKPNKRIFDNSKISDHFAIIPTLETPKNLSEPEAKLYDLVVRRFLAVFYPAAEFRVTTRTVSYTHLTLPTNREV